MTVPHEVSFPDGTAVLRLGYGAMRLTGQPSNFGPYANWDEGKRLAGLARV